MGDVSRSELLYGTTDPHETPLVMPAWARQVPELAKQIDDGYALRRAAGLPIDSSVNPVAASGSGALRSQG